MEDSEYHQHQTDDRFCIVLLIFLQACRTPELFQHQLFPLTEDLVFASHILGFFRQRLTALFGGHVKSILHVTRFNLTPKGFLVSESFASMINVCVVHSSVIFNQSIGFGILPLSTKLLYLLCQLTEYSVIDLSCWS